MILCWFYQLNLGHAPSVSLLQN